MEVLAGLAPPSEDCEELSVPGSVLRDDLLMFTWHSPWVSVYL